MSIENRIYASPQTLEERMAMDKDPVAALRAKWFVENFQQGLERQLHLTFDPVMTNSDAISYKRAGATVEDAERIVAWLSHLHLKFKQGITGPFIPYCQLSERTTIDGQYVYFVVKLMSRGLLSLVCRF